MNRNALFLLLLAVPLTGCQPDPAPIAGEPGAQAVTSGGEKPAVPPPSPAGSPTGEPVEPAGATLAQLPAELKHDAFEYYGLSNEGTMPLEVTYSNGDVKTGAQTAQIKEVKNGRATFGITRTGGLFEAFGSSEDVMELDKSGVYALSTSAGKLEGRQLEVPTGLVPGKTWKVNSKIELNEGGKVQIDHVFKVEGMRKIKTKLTEYPQALLITSKGTMRTQNGSARMETRSYYVRGRGAVRSEIKQIPAAGKPVTMVIQETK